MNVEQFCADYGATVESLPEMLAHATDDLRESFGYSLEETLLSRQAALATAEARFARNIRAIDQRLGEMAMLVRERLGVDVEAFLSDGVPEPRRSIG